MASEAESFLGVREETEVCQFHVLTGNGTRGPFTLAELGRMWQEREIDDDTLLAQPGADRWRKLAELNIPRPGSGRRLLCFALLSFTVLVGGLCLIEPITVWCYGEAAGPPEKYSEKAARRAVFEKFPGTPKIRSIRRCWEEEFHLADTAPAFDYEAEVDYVNELGGPVRKRFPIHVRLYYSFGGAEWSGQVITDKDYCITCNPKRFRAELKAEAEARLRKYEAELEAIRRGTR